MYPRESARTHTHTHTDIHTSSGRRINFECRLVIEAKKKKERKHARILESEKKQLFIKGRVWMLIEEHCTCFHLLFISPADTEGT